MLFNKLLKIIKRFSVVIILFSIFQISYSQDLNKKISVKIKNSTLLDVINEISESGQINFSYSPQQIPLNNKVSIKAKNKTIQEILDEVLKKNGIDYKVVENQVVLNATISVQNQIQNNPVKTNEIEKSKYTISGYIKDSLTGEILIGAVVYLKGSSLGTLTNSYGFYSITLPEGNYLAGISYLGYRSTFRNIELYKDIKYSAELGILKFDLKEVEIQGEDYRTDIIANQLSEIKFTSKIISVLPGFVGDFDVIKSLEAIPGINTYGDGSSFYYVRGGNSDQNLLLLDDAPIYNPSHLFGIFSAIAPDAIKDINIYKGDFPADYGGRLSSVIDIKSKDGNLRSYGAFASLSPFTSELSVEGPIIRDRSSFYVSARRSNLGWLKYSESFDKSLSLMFFDINSKLNYKFNDNNRLFFTFYGGKDDLSRGSSNHTYGISWDNILGTIRWNHNFNNKLFSNTTLYSSRYNYFLFISKELNDYWTSSISNLSLKTDFTYYLNPGNTIKSGLEVNTHYSNPGNVHFSDIDVQNHVPEIPKYNSIEYDFYISNEQELTKKLSLRYGLRLPLWEDFGPTTVYSYNVNYNVFDTVKIAKNYIYYSDISPEPRINIKYSVNSNSSIKAGYNRSVQFIQLLTNSNSPFNSLEVWAPAGPNIKPQKTDQFALGYFLRLIKSKLNLSVETFYKKFYNSIDYKDHANMLFNPLIEGELRFGKAWSYGIEFTVRKTEGKFTGWIGYTYSRAFKQIEGINNNNSYPAFYDRPNDFCLNLSYEPNNHWGLSGNWFYVTGSAISTPTSFYYDNGYSAVPVYDKKNNDRLPAYHRLDLSVNYKFGNPAKKFRHSIIFTVYNVYNRENPISVNFNKKVNASGQYVVPSDLENSSELVPTTISVLGIIPSITYNFKF